MTLRRLVHERIAPLTAYTPKPATAIKLDANESPFSLPDTARRRLAEALAAIDLNRYPDPRANRLRELLAAKLGGDPADLTLGTGSDEVICLLLSALSAPRDGATTATVLFPEPSFVMYRHNSIVCGLAPFSVPLTPSFDLDVPAFVEAIAAHQPNLIFLATPNNPTGNAFDEADIRAVIAAAAGTLVVIDEAYAPFSGRSLCGLADELDNVAIMGTLSKVGLAGARVGYCRLPPSISGDVDKGRQPYNLASLSMVAAELALGELGDVFAAQTAAIVSERDRLATALAEHASIRPLPSDANFILVHVREGGAAALASRLREFGICVRSFGGTLADYLRVTVGLPAENDALLAALAAIAAD